MKDMTNDKLEAVRKLVEMGYKAVYENHIVMILNVPFSEARKACKSINYCGSYGVRNEEKEAET